MTEQINEKPVLTESEKSLCLKAGGLVLRPDFEDMIPRLRPSNLGGEIIVKAARFKSVDYPLIAVDATAGLGEDSLLLAAAGFTVHMYERNPVISALLNDALTRAASSEYEILRSAAARMVLHTEDSISAMKNLDFTPDIVLLDPMFPKRQKSGLIKKKFQLLQQLESPAEDGEALLDAALSAGPRRIIIKRPAKGPYLAGRKPSYSIKGGNTRCDCIILPSRSTSSRPASL